MVLFLPENQQATGLTPTVGPAMPNLPDAPAPSWLDTADASFTLYNDVKNVLDYAARPTFTPEPDYHPLDDVALKGSVYERDYLDHFAGSQSQAETLAIIGRIDGDLRARQVRSRAGFAGFMTDLAAGAASPLTFVPVAGWLSRGINLSRAGRIGLAAAETGGIVAATAGIQQAILAGTKEIPPTAEEIVWTVGGAAVLGAALGAVAGTISRPAFNELVSRLGQELPGDEAAAAAVMNRAAGETVTDLPMPAGVGAEAVTQPGTGRLKGALGLEKSPIAQQDPLFRLLTSPSREERLLVQELAEIPGTLQDAAKGITKPLPVEFLSKAYEADYYRAVADLKRLHNEYWFGRDTSFGTFRSGMASTFGQSRGRMTITEFDRAVFNAAYAGDISPIPQVQRAAQAFRQLDEKLKKAAVREKLFADDVKPGDDVSHVFRMWDTRAVARDRVRLAGILAEDFAERLGLRAAPRVTKWKATMTRLLAAEAAPEKLAKAAEKLAKAEREMVPTPPAEIKSIAEEAINTILGFNPSRAMLPRDVMTGARGPLKERMLRITTDKVKDFVVQSARDTMRATVRTMATDIALARRDLLKPSDIEARLAKINDEYTRLIEANPTRSAALTREQEAGKRDLLAIIERLRGMYAIPENPGHIAWGVLRVARNWNVVTKMGNVVVSSISDVGKLISNYGLDAIKTAWHPFVRGLKSLEMPARDLQDAASNLELLTHARQMAINDVTDVYGRGTMIERAVQAGTDKFGLVSLMDPWNYALKTLAGVSAMKGLLRSVERIAAGKASVKEIEYAASNYIDHTMAQRIAKEFEAHGVKDGNVWSANTSAWKDTTAGEAMRAALHREVNRTIVTPGQDIPLWMSKPTMRMLGQFKSFAVSSVQRTMLTGLQERDMKALSGAFLMLSLGAMQYYIKSKLAGREPSDDYRVWSAEAFNNSGLSGWLMDANAVLEKATQGQIGLKRLTGRELSRFAATDLFGMLGPTTGTARDMISLLGGATGAGFTQSDVNAFRRLLPLQNVFYLRWLFDAAENGANNAFGIQKRTGTGG